MDIAVKILKGVIGEIDIDVPCDRNGAFDPLIIPKGHTRLRLFKDKIIALYAHGTA